MNLPRGALLSPIREWNLKPLPHGTKWPPLPVHPARSYSICGSCIAMSLAKVSLKTDQRFKSYASRQIGCVCESYAVRAFLRGKRELILPQQISMLQSAQWNGKYLRGLEMIFQRFYENKTRQFLKFCILTAGNFWKNTVWFFALLSSLYMFSETCCVFFVFFQQHTPHIHSLSSSAWSIWCVYLAQGVNTHK